ncbi:MAG TPA: hypothetical protein VGE76_01605 [Opitutaceae bacterium]
MNRSVFRPLRTRRVACTLPASTNKTAATAAAPRDSVRKTVSVLGAVCLAFAASSACYGGAGGGGAPADVAPALSAEQKKNPQLVRGRYLVEQVGMCADCHSPRNEQGQFLTDSWLKGGLLPLKPIVPMPFTAVAPAIAGLPTMNEAQAKVFLTTGKRADGSYALPPMPPYRFSPGDADAVIAYLRLFAKNGGEKSASQ